MQLVQASPNGSFGTVLEPGPQQSKVSSKEVLTNSPITFGRFTPSSPAPVQAIPDRPTNSKFAFKCGSIDCHWSKIFEDENFKPRFVGSLFWQNWSGDSLPFPNILIEQILDQRQAGYSDEDIKDCINFFGLPPTDIALKILECC